jgi:5'-nucleotidase
MSVMPFNLDDMLVVAITSRALFDLHESDQVFRDQGLDAYRAHQLEREDDPLGPGTAFPLVRGLLSVNERAGEHMTEVVILSRNDGDSGLRLMNSIEHHGLDISRAAFRGGEDPWAYLKAFRCDLFLSADPPDVQEALHQRVPSALVLDPPERLDASAEDIDQVRIAFDGDAVLFDDESERYFQEHGLDSFLAREAELADEPMDPGPFKPFLMALGRIQNQFSERESPIRTALVTSRNAPAHKRVIKTLRTWGVHVDESVFLGGVDKAEILEAMRPHIFFDDQLTHLERTRLFVPSAHVLAPGEQAQLFEDDTATPQVHRSVERADTVIGEHPSEDRRDVAG